MSRTIRRPAYIRENTFEKYMDKQWRWYRPTKTVRTLKSIELYNKHADEAKARYEDEVRAFNRKVEWEKDRRTRCAVLNIPYIPYYNLNWPPRWFKVHKYHHVTVHQTIEEYEKKCRLEWNKYSRDGCDGLRSSVRSVAVCGKLSGWGDSPKSFKKTAKRIARRQLKEMLKKEIHDVVDFDL